MTETPTPPSRAVALRYDGPRGIADLREYALLLAFDTNPEGQYKRNDALPATFRGNPGAVAFAVEYAKALDVSPVTAIMGVHMIDGKLAASAGLISALVRRAGHRIRTWTEGTIEAGTFRAMTTITRHDDPDFEYRSEWTLERAARAGLMRRDDRGRLVAVKARSGWDNYPENMAKARSITEASRDAAEDAILGVHYTPEELGVDVDDTGEPVYTVTQVDNPAPAPPRAPAPAAVPEEAPAPPRALVDEIRAGILDARTEEALVAVWDSKVKTKARGEAMVTADEHGVETTVLALLLRAGEAIRAGHPLTGGDDVVDADVVEDATPAAEPVAEPVVEEAPAEPVADAVTAEDLIERLRELPIPQARKLLDAVMVGLGPAEQTDAVGWAHREGINPTISSGNMAAVLSAILTGEAFESGEPARALIESVLAHLAATDVRTDWQRERDHDRAAKADTIAAARDAARNARTS